MPKIEPPRKHTPGTCWLTRCENPPEWENGICDFHLSVVCTACGDRVRAHHGSHPIVCIPCGHAEGRKKRAPRILGIAA